MAGDTPCRLWQGTTNADGYGVLAVAHNGSRLAHRKALSQRLGRPITDGMKALHTCDTPACIEDTHLYEGTQAANMRDAKDRGRTTGRFRDVEKCVNGHDFTPENTQHYTSPKGRQERRCLACRRDRNKLVSAQRKAARNLVKIGSPA